MSERGVATESTRSQAQAPAVDLSGRRALARNVFSSWIAHVVLMALGFIMPRLVHHQAGQAALGVWDFCWSVVNYLSLLDLGVGTFVNRTVARLRDEASATRLSETISSVVCVQAVLAAAMAATTLVLAWSIPVLFAERLAADARAAGWIVALLGIGLAVQTLFDAARGVITGCHRWDLYNGLNVGSQYVAAAGMVGALLLGYGLVGMAAVHLAVTCAAEVLRFRIARHVCPELRLELGAANRADMREALRFGLKSVVINTPNLVTVQTASVMVLSALGPAALAVFARPMALTRHMSVFVDKFSAVLTPTAGFLQKAGGRDELREFFLSATRFSVALTLPIVIFLSINGDWVLRAWMGDEYVNRGLIATLAMLSFLTVAQSSVAHVMIGLNAHGRVGAVALAATVGGLALALAVGQLWGWTLLRAAALLLAPLAISKGVLLPWMSCRRLDIPIPEYLRHCFAGPVAVGAAFALCLFAGRWIGPEGGLFGVVASTALGALVLGVAYWRRLLSEEARRRLSARFVRKPRGH